LKSDAGIPASASIENGWLALCLPLKDADPWDLLKRNGDLPGLCKFARNIDRPFPQLRADLPLDCGENPGTLPRRILETLEGFRFALKERRHPAATRDAEAAAAAGSDSPAPEDSTDLAGILKQTGWPFVKRSDLKYAVDLEVRDTFVQATVESRSGLGIVACTEAARFESLPAIQRSALGIYLLAACGALRMARVSAAEAEGSVSVSFEVRLIDPEPAELSHALAALSVAAGLCSREAQCFENQETAEIYLLTNGRTGVEQK
jgi:hypothetical protein